MSQDRLTRPESDALDRFDAEALAELWNQGDETMTPVSFFTRGRLAAAASILVMIAGLYPVLNGLVGNRNESPPAGVPDTRASDSDAPRRVSFLVGLPFDGGGPTEVKVPNRKRGGALIEMPWVQYTFSLDAANKQRAAALEKAGKDPKATLRAMGRYALRDADGHELPIYWMPYCARIIADRSLATEAEVLDAFAKAANREPFDARLVQGRWVYADPEVFDRPETAASEKIVASAGLSVGRRGLRCVSVELHRQHQADFEDYTARYVGSALCIVVDGQVWMEPIIREAIGGATLQISGGAKGFSEAAADHLLEAFGHPRRKEPIEPGQRRK